MVVGISFASKLSLPPVYWGQYWEAELRVDSAVHFRYIYTSIEKNHTLYEFIYFWAFSPPSPILNLRPNFLISSFVT